MRQNHIVLGETPKARVRAARVFDDKIGDFIQTATRRGAFERLSRCKSSVVQTPPCGLRLKFVQNRSRLNSNLIVHRP